MFMKKKLKNDRTLFDRKYRNTLEISNEKLPTTAIETRRREDYVSTARTLFLEINYYYESKILAALESPSARKRE